MKKQKVHKLFNKVTDNLPMGKNWLKGRKICFKGQNITQTFLSLADKQVKLIHRGGGGGW